MKKLNWGKMTDRGRERIVQGVAMTFQRPVDEVRWHFKFGFLGRERSIQTLGSWMGMRKRDWTMSRILKKSSRYWTNWHEQITTKEAWQDLKAAWMESWRPLIDWLAKVFK